MVHAAGRECDGCPGTRKPRPRGRGFRCCRSRLAAVDTNVSEGSSQRKTMIIVTPRGVMVQRCAVYRVGRLDFSEGFREVLCTTPLSRCTSTVECSCAPRPPLRSSCSRKPCSGGVIPCGRTRRLVTSDLTRWTMRCSPPEHGTPAECESRSRGRDSVPVFTVP